MASPWTRFAVGMCIVVMGCDGDTAATATPDGTAAPTTGTADAGFAQARPGASASASTEIADDPAQEAADGAAAEPVHAICHLETGRPPEYCFAWPDPKTGVATIALPKVSPRGSPAFRRLKEIPRRPRLVNRAIEWGPGPGFFWYFDGAGEQRPSFALSESDDGDLIDLLVPGDPAASPPGNEPRRIDKVVDPTPPPPPWWLPLE